MLFLFLFNTGIPILKDKLEKTLNSGVDETKPICKLQRFILYGDLFMHLYLSNDGAMAH